MMGRSGDGGAELLRRPVENQPIELMYSLSTYKKESVLFGCLQR